MARVDYFMDALGFARWPTFNSDIASKVVFYAGARRVINPIDPEAANFDHADIVNSLNRHRVVLLQGTTGALPHWMLVTALMKDAAGNVTHLVANDPELGQQVLIDMNPASATYKQVTDPPNYASLAFFTFTASKYFSAVIKPGP